MPKILNLVGMKQGKLTVLKKLPKVTGERTRYLCGCYCGNYCEYFGHEITHKYYPRKSCNKCYPSQKYPKEYVVWEGMIQRCENKNSKRYHMYGGRGILVCYRWRLEFFFFLEDMGVCPSEFHTIERQNVNKGYEPGNCIWLLEDFQQDNKTTSIINRL